MKKMWLKSDCVCLAMGDAVALNLMFENKRDHELFFKLWKKYLGKMADLLNYHLTPTGWILLFRTKSSEEIKDAYHDFRGRSKKAKAESTLDDDSRILSEHFRIFLSQFVRRTNAIHGRRGTKVLRRFHRYVFQESADYAQFFEMITRRFRKMPQKRAKYQADESRYDVRGEMDGDSVLKVGTRVYMGLEERFRVCFGVVCLLPTSPVLRKFMNPSKPNNIHPPFS